MRNLNLEINSCHLLNVTHYIRYLSVSFILPLTLESLIKSGRDVILSNDVFFLCFGSDRITLKIFVVLS